jgi:hypothetical protein
MGRPIDSLISLSVLLDPQLAEAVTNAYWDANGSAPKTYTLDLPWRLSVLALNASCLSPHAFRRAAKATVTFFGGAHPRMIEGVLQHNGLWVGEEHCDTSPIHRAALELTAIVKRLRKA